MENPDAYPEYGGHPGVDFACREGVEVRAAFAGTVIFAGEHFSRGLYVIIDHGDGLYSYYMHLSQLDAEFGQKAEQGEVVGLSGSTGKFRWPGEETYRRVAPHLHFDLRRDGVPIDPREVGLI